MADARPGYIDQKAWREMLEEIVRKLNADGKLIEAGWVGLRLAAIPETAPQIQLDEMRLAFFAGAQHLWGCLNGGLLDPDPNAEPTEKDLARMEAINDELNRFLAEFKKRKGIV
jgi:hypothetical protein